MAGCFNKAEGVLRCLECEDPGFQKTRLLMFLVDTESVRRSCKGSTVHVCLRNFGLSNVPDYLRRRVATSCGLQQNSPNTSTQARCKHKVKGLGKMQRQSNTLGGSLLSPLQALLTQMLDMGLCV